MRFLREIVAYKGIVFGAFSRLLFLGWNDQLSSSDEIAISKDLLEIELIIGRWLGSDHLGSACEACHNISLVRLYYIARQATYVSWSPCLPRNQ